MNRGRIIRLAAIFMVPIIAIAIEVAGARADEADFTFTIQELTFDKLEEGTRIFVGCLVAAEPFDENKSTRPVGKVGWASRQYDYELAGDHPATVPVSAQNGADPRTGKYWRCNLYMSPFPEGRELIAISPDADSEVARPQSEDDVYCLYGEIGTDQVGVCR